MCGRFNLRTNPKAIEFAFGAMAPADLTPRFNISPSQQVICIRPGKELAILKWGLIPSWAKDPKIGYSLINARCETVGEKPSFRSAFKKRRCLIPATGFYEWEKDSKPKTPPHFHLKDDSLFAFAGLWECWHDQNGKPVESCSIVTTEANSLVKPYHDRMPVILPKEAYDQWLDVTSEPDKLKELLQPFDVKAMSEEAVSTLVNSPKNEGPSLLSA
jgi:putative SOS response-associated peptidase YedK